MENAKKNKLLLLALPLAVIAIVATIWATAPVAQASLDDTDAVQSEEYTTDIKLAELSVALTEDNGEGAVLRSESTNGEVKQYGALLENLNGGEKLSFGKWYTEQLAAKNDGEHDQYVRVVLDRYWHGTNGEKVTSLDPGLIELKFSDDWFVFQGENEQTILYSKHPVKKGESSTFATEIRIKKEILEAAEIVDVTTSTGDETRFVTTTYTYGPFMMGLDAEVSAVQTHSAAEAIKSAWGVDVTMSGDEITSVN
ncbi:MAG: hypothetical protein HFJ65_04865 [Eggerthellaceae bacterium]|nr:hypothetical protein [Eggerthellaceae bacterium]